MDAHEKREQLYKNFKSAHPETIGETDSHFDCDNFADYLTSRIAELERELSKERELILDLEPILIVWANLYSHELGIHPEHQKLLDRIKDIQSPETLKKGDKG